MVLEGASVMDNSWGWAIFQFAGLTRLACVITFIVYQVGGLMAGYNREVINHF